jgi:phosphomannomutase / phosphoglucomutase
MTNKSSTDNKRNRNIIEAHQAASNKRHAIKRRIFLSLLLVFAILNAFIGFYLYQRLILTNENENLSILSSQVADERKQDLSNYIKQQRKMFENLAQDQSIKQRILDNDSAQRSFHEKSLEERLSALKVRIIPLATAQKTDEGPVPIRFSELDLINRTEKGEMPEPEALKIDKNWFIHWIAPISRDNQVIGTIMVTMPAEDLFKRFRAADSSLGEFELLQEFTASPSQTLSKIGTADSSVSATVKIPNTFWLIKFTASNNLRKSASEPLTVWLVIMGSITFISIALCWIAGRVAYMMMLRKDTGQKQSLQEVVKLGKQNEDDTPVGLIYQNKDILDVDIIAEDKKILGIDESTGKQTGISNNNLPTIDPNTIPAQIFRAYDIRGIYGKELTLDLALKLGHAIGSEALDQGEKSIIVARDARTHSEELMRVLIKGILATGCDVINIGTVPTPLLYFATFHFSDTRSGVMVTASHNPKEFNGFKVVMQNQALSDNRVQELRERIINQRIHQGAGQETYREIIDAYIERIFSDVAIAGQIKIVVDAANAVPGIVAPRLFEELGCNVIPLFCELDGNFPNHEPDPTVEKNLQALIAKVKETQADLGVAFDGDGDRLVVVTPRGDILWPDRLLMLFAKDVLQRNPGADILFDVKCSRLLNQVISGYGGRPIMWKTGHSPMKAKMEETRALIGGEYSGHIFIKDRWYGFDDGIYAMARLLEIITLRDQKIDAIFAAFPSQVATPEIRVVVDEKDKFSLVNAIVEHAKFPNAVVSTIDGLRVDFERGWALVRASNTSAALTFRFEAESKEILDKIQMSFKQEIRRIHPTLNLNF